MSKRFRDQDMLARSGDGYDEQHVSKRKQRNKALEIVFDPKSHKEYITGFRKRKQQRRKEALSNLEKKQRQQRIEERAERRQAQKDQLHLEKYAINSDDDDSRRHNEGDNDDETAPRDVKVFNGHGGDNALISTVTIVPIRVGSGGSSDEEEGEEEDEEEMPAAAEARKAEKRRVREEQRQRQEEEEQSGKNSYGRATKLSKTALRIMTKTKSKIEGKKDRHHRRAKKGSGRDGGSGSGGGRNNKRR